MAKKYLAIILFLMPLCGTQAQQNGDNIIFIQTQLEPEQALGTLTQVLHTQGFEIDTVHNVMLSLETKPKKIVSWLKVFNLSISASVMYDERLKLEGKWIKASVFGGIQEGKMQPLVYDKDGMEAKIWQELEKIVQAYIKQSESEITYARE